MVAPCCRRHPLIKLQIYIHVSNQETNVILSLCFAIVYICSVLSDPGFASVVKGGPDPNKVRKNSKTCKNRGPTMIHACKTVLRFPLCFLCLFCVFCLKEHIWNAYLQIRTVSYSTSMCESAVSDSWPYMDLNRFGLIFINVHKCSRILMDVHWFP